MLNFPWPKNVRDRCCLSILGIDLGHNQPPIGKCRAWTPAVSGWTISLALVQRFNAFRCGYVVRNYHGDFHCGGSFEVRGLHGLDHLMQGIVKVCHLYQSLGLQVMTVQSSNLFMGDLLFAKKESIPWDLIASRRRFHAEFNHVTFQRVNPAQNGTALAISFADQSDVYMHWHDLPRR